MADMRSINFECIAPMLSDETLARIIAEITDKDGYVKDKDDTGQIVVAAVARNVIWERSGRDVLIALVKRYRKNLK